MKLMSEAARIDMEADQESFLSDFKEHVRHDIMDLASRPIRERIRRQENLDRWGRMLVEINGESTDKEVRRRISTRLKECADLRGLCKKINHFSREMNKEQERKAELEKAKQILLQETGVTIPESITFSQIDTFLLASMLKQLSRLEELIISIHEGEK